MTQTFACPNCHAALDIEPGSRAVTVKCAYCSSTVIVPDSLRQRSHGEFSPDKQSAVMQEIMEMVQQGRKIEAIKRFREAYGVGLKEAKDVVDGMERQETVWAGETFASGEQTAVTAEVLALVQQGRKIDAIRHYREAHGVGLKEAKEAVEQLSGQSVTVLDGATGQSSGRGCLVTLALVAMAVLGVAGFVFLSDGLPGLGLGQVDEVVTAVQEEVAGLSTAAAIAPTETPGFADVALEVGGEEGIGPGFFNDTRWLSMDAEGNLYTGDFDGGRIQVFFANGEFSHQFIVDADLTMQAMTVTRDGVVHVGVGNEVRRYDGATGEQLDSLPFDLRARTMTTAPDGSIVILERDRLLRLDAQGNTTLDITDPFADIPDFQSNNYDLAVDGAGNIYVSGTDAIFVMDSNGRYQNRFGSVGDAPDQFRAQITAVAVDGQGRVYAADFAGIKVFDGNGRYLDFINLGGITFDMEFTNQNDLVVMDRNGNRLLRYQLNR